MLQSLPPFLVSVAEYWWLIATGIFAPLVFDVPAMLGSERFQERWRAKLPQIRRHLRWGLVLGLMVAMFLAYHDERTERLKLVDAGKGASANVCGAALENLGQSVGPGKITRLVRVTASRQTPYGITFTARGLGLENFRVSPRDHRRLEVFSEKPLPDGKSVFISEPRGLFDVFITAKDPNAIVFGYEFQCEG